MDFAFDRIDLAACRRNGDSPVLVRPRKTGEVWYVPITPLELKRQPTWTFFRREDAIEIPLLPYLLRPEPELALAYMLSLGLACSLALPPIRRLHLAIGSPTEHVEPHGGCELRYYVGFGVLLDTVPPEEIGSKS